MNLEKPKITRKEANKMIESRMKHSILILLFPEAPNYNNVRKEYELINNELMKEFDIKEE